jgi:hypothetical protein
MPNSFTANLGLEKPEVGADANLWGGHLNSDLDIIDSVFTGTTTRPISSQILSSTKYLDVTTTSKAMMLAMSSISAGATRTLTVQDSDGTIALIADLATATTGMATTGSVAAATVGMMDLTSVQTATNKTLTAPLLTGILAASTGVTTTAASNNTKLATTAYADRIGVQQIQTTITGVMSTGTTLNLYNDSIPTNIQGDEYMQVTITPESATSKLVIDVVANYSANQADNLVTALFQDSTVNALRAVAVNLLQPGGMISTSFRWEMTSGTTSATTFKVRIGGTAGGSLITFNGSLAGRLLGGVMASSITITEMGI